MNLLINSPIPKVPSRPLWWGRMCKSVYMPFVLSCSLLCASVVLGSRHRWPLKRCYPFGSTSRKESWWRTCHGYCLKPFTCSTTNDKSFGESPQKRDPIPFSYLGHCKTHSSEQCVLMGVFDKFFSIDRCVRDKNWTMSLHATSTLELSLSLFDCTFSFKRSSSTRSGWRFWNLYTQNCFCSSVSDAATGSNVLPSLEFQVFRTSLIMRTLSGFFTGFFVVRKSSKLSVSGSITTFSICFITFAAFSGWTLGEITIFLGYFPGSDNQSGPCHQRWFSSFTIPPLLATSAAFWSVGTCRHFTW